MDFLPDVWVTCEDCAGTRFGENVLACRVDGQSIAQVLDITVDEVWRLLAVPSGPKVRLALDTSSGLKTRPPSGICSPGGAAPGSPKARGAVALETRLAALQQCGLGYVLLGQPTRTLSGGERGRLVLAAALAVGGDGPGLYLFDEPTRGLHPEEVERLLVVFDGLIAAGHTLVVVEHNLDVIRQSDWVIDLGPEGGDGGGRIVAAGPPEAIAACAASHTGRALRAALVAEVSPREPISGA
jgi:excinuclease ABC subunit A